uniref:Uncharacterized protein n=1 Tax=Steinernema glaseri TaxID=37863 RepID=A0A1I7YXV4_9BILA
MRKRESKIYDSPNPKKAESRNWYYLNTACSRPLDSSIFGKLSQSVIRSVLSPPEVKIRVISNVNIYSLEYFALIRTEGHMDFRSSS